MLPEPPQSPIEDRQQIMEESVPKCPDEAQEASPGAPDDDPGTVESEPSIVTIIGPFDDDHRGRQEMVRDNLPSPAPDFSVSDPET